MRYNSYLRVRLLQLLVGLVAVLAGLAVSLALRPSSDPALAGQTEILFSSSGATLIPTTQFNA
jgi:hypothetical protein